MILHLFQYSLSGYKCIEYKLMKSTHNNYCYFSWFMNWHKIPRNPIKTNTWVSQLFVSEISMHYGVWTMYQMLHYALLLMLAQVADLLLGPFLVSHRCGNLISERWYSLPKEQLTRRDVLKLSRLSLELKLLTLFHWNCGY